MRRTISPQQQRPKRRHEDDLRDPHGAGPTQERAKDGEESGELVARLLGGGKDRADPVRDCWGEEKKKLGCDKCGRRQRSSKKRETEERETRCRGRERVTVGVVAFGVLAHTLPISRGN
jgi:hypothetical protein